MSGHVEVSSEPTRRSGRHDRHRTPEPVLAPTVRPRLVLATIAGAALLSLCELAGRPFLALGMALVALVLARGWPGLLGSTSRRSSQLVLTVTTLALEIAVLGGTGLELVPMAMAGALVVMFIVQLVRSDGRANLSRCLAADALGLALLTSGMVVVPLAVARRDEGPVTAAMAAIAVAAVLDLLLTRARLRPWLLPLAGLLGALAATAVAAAAGWHADLLIAAVIGLIAGASSHALRRVLTALPTSKPVFAELVIAAAGLLVPGYATYAIAQTLLT